MNDEQMATYVRAIVSDDEKKSVKDVCRKLGVNESQLIRASLQKMGVEIEVEKPVGAPVGSNNNPAGNPDINKHYQEWLEKKDAE